MSDGMRMKRTYYMCAGALVLGCIIIYCFPGAFHLHSGAWHVYPREWVQVDGAHRSRSSFTYLTYNILNDAYMKRYIDNYASCTGVDHFMNVTLRQSHIMMEVETMNPDVACFQEIDVKWYDSYWYPLLSARGYEGMLGVDESHPFKVGQAIFWKKNKFSMDFNEKNFYHDLVKPYAENTLDTNEQTEFMSWFKKRSLLLLAELQDVRSRSRPTVIVGCTYISAVQFDSPAMQTLQVSLALQRMDAFSATRGTAAMILSGDFNTPPHYPAYEFIKTGVVTENMRKSFNDKTPLHKLGPEMKKFALEVLDLMPTAFTHKVDLRSAYHAAMGSEPHTTCYGDYTLDYIWYTPDYLQVSGILKEPEISQVMRGKKTQACQVFASDHLPVEAQFYFIPPKS